MSRIILLGAIAGLLTLPALASTITLFQTGFEAAEGYDPNFDLEDQQGWLGTGGNSDFDNGLLSDFIPNLGQHAYIGFAGAGIEAGAVYVWRPLDAASAAFPKVQFSVSMLIADSMDTTNRDYFDWAVFNRDGDQLFTVEFDNDDLGVYYALENGTNFIWTGAVFEPDTPYHFTIDMDFSRNRWSASMSDTQLVSDEVITEFGSSLELGDVDAVWIFRDPDAPGDNFMVFDDYSITATNVPRPYLTNLTQLVNGDVLLRVVGEPGKRYAVEVTTDLIEWSALATNTADSGFFDYVDDTASDYPTSFYRARLTP